MKQAKNSQKLPPAPSEGRNCSTPKTATIMPTKTHSVTRPPPKRSDTQPVPARLSAPTSGPRKANCSAFTSGNCVFIKQREARRIADEAAEGAGVEDAHDPVVEPREDHRLVREGRLGRGDVVHPEIGGDGRGQDEGHPDEAGVLQPELAAVRQRLRIAAQRAEDAHGDDDRHQELHDRHAEVAETGVQRQRVALFRLREEEADIGHRRGEVAAAQAAEQRQHQEDQVGGLGVLHRIADAHRGQQQRGGRKRRPQPAAEDRHHEAVEDAQGRAREARQRRQPEQLALREVEADGRQTRHHDRPHHPDREGQQQRRDRDPQVAVRDALALGVPERRVLGVPLGQRRGRVTRPGWACPRIRAVPAARRAPHPDARAPCAGSPSASRSAPRRPAGTGKRNRSCRCR